MFAYQARIAVIALSVAAFSAPQSDACEFLRRCFGGATYYRPYTAAYAPVCCARPVCCPQPTVSYMPQTCYRTVYQSVPVVAYRPVTACDPCTGCPRTVMQPVTSYVSQARLVGYTSYRPVVAASYAGACATGCAPVAATAAYPTGVAYPSYAAAGPCCGSSAAVALPGAVGSTVTSVAPSTPLTSPSTTVAPSTVVPPTPQPTFEQPSAPAAEPESRLMQPLELGPSTTLGAPQSLDPQTQDRMAYRTAGPASVTRLVSSNGSITRYSDDGWRAAGE